jgi:hypothetical protein
MKIRDRNPMELSNNSIRIIRIEYIVACFDSVLNEFNIQWEKFVMKKQLTRSIPTEKHFSGNFMAKCNDFKSISLDNSKRNEEK